jgi:major membrane immunogen (membrane-anchored lipoprotein)
MAAVAELGPPPTMIMKLITATTTLLAVLLFAGCSKSDNGSPSASASSVYPKDAASVTSDTTYKLAFKSDQTGISYYLRRLAMDEVGKMPEDFVITSETVSLVFVPIKDGKIVDAPLSDRAALAYKIPAEMLK